MESGSIPDNRITASSQISQAKNGRLNREGSWCASTSDSNPYLEIDLQTFHIICAVSTQGDSLTDNWVKTYSLQISTDGTFWTNYNEFEKVKETAYHYFPLAAHFSGKYLLLSHSKNWSPSQKILKKDFVNCWKTNSTMRKHCQRSLISTITLLFYLYIDFRSFRGMTTERQRKRTLSMKACWRDGCDL